MARRIGLVLGLLVLVVLGGAAYVWFSGGSGEPSTEVTAPSITSAPTTTPRQPEETAATTSPVEETAATTVPVETTAAADPGAGTTTSAVLYRIDKDQSSVSFEIDEVLNGSPFRVVGVTSEVAGEILIDFEDPPASQLGAIVINVRTLATDSGFRDRAIRGPILGSSRDENEFATFEPDAIEGLPDRVAVGDRLPLTITGTFTLSGVSRPVTFDTEVDVGSEERVEVTGTATVLRSDFGLTIPDIPSVSDVEEEVLLVIQLVAVPAGS